MVYYNARYPPSLVSKTDDAINIQMMLYLIMSETSILYLYAPYSCKNYRQI